MTNSNTVRLGSLHTAAGAMIVWISLGQLWASTANGIRKEAYVRLQLTIAIIKDLRAECDARDIDAPEVKWLELDSRLIAEYLGFPVLTAQLLADEWQNGRRRHMKETHSNRSAEILIATAEC